LIETNSKVTTDHTAQYRNMALHSLYCADVPLRNCSLTQCLWTKPELFILTWYFWLTIFQLDLKQEFFWSLPVCLSVYLSCCMLSDS